MDGLGFGDFELGVVTIAAAVFAWLALYVYRAYFFDLNWQTLYYGTTMLNVALSLLQLLLVYGDTGGLPKLLFAVCVCARVRHLLLLVYHLVFLSYCKFFFFLYFCTRAHYATHKTSS